MLILPLIDLLILSGTGMLVIGILNYLAVVIWSNWYTVGWWNLWNFWILVAAKSEDRRLTLKTTEP